MILILLKQNIDISIDIKLLILSITIDIVGFDDFNNNRNIPQNSMIRGYELADYSNLSFLIVATLNFLPIVSECL